MSIYAIETKGLTKKYGTQLSVNGLDLHVKKGEIYCLLGRNGAGKTTTMRMMMDLIKPTSGHIKLFDEDYLYKPKMTYKRIGCLIESPGFYENLTGFENLKILAKLRGKHRADTIENALLTVGLENEKKKVFSNYSLGMKQRLGIAAAVMHEPEILILDEPTNGLDPVGINEIRKYLINLSKEKNITILVSSHILSEIEKMADTIGVIHEGRLLEEIRMDDLHKKNRRYLEIKVSDEKKSALLFEEQLRISDFTIFEDKTIRVYTDFDRINEINKVLVENEIDVFKLNTSEEKLEDYFTNLIGGGGIG